MRHVAPVIAATVITAAATGCSSGSHPAASQGPQHVTIRANGDFRFDSPTVTAHPGELRVTLVDTSGYPHNLSVADLHTTSSTVTGTPGQQSVTFGLTFPRPGTYDFICTYHSTAGMRGRFVIR